VRLMKLWEKKACIKNSVKPKDLTIET